MDRDTKRTAGQISTMLTGMVFIFALGCFINGQLPQSHAPQIDPVDAYIMQHAGEAEFLREPSAGQQVATVIDPYATERAAQHKLVGCVQALDTFHVSTAECRQILKE